MKNTRFYSTTMRNTYKILLLCLASVVAATAYGIEEVYIVPANAMGQFVSVNDTTYQGQIKMTQLQNDTTVSGTPYFRVGAITVPETGFGVYVHFTKDDTSGQRDTFYQLANFAQSPAVVDLPNPLMISSELVPIVPPASGSFAINFYPRSIDGVDYQMIQLQPMDEGYAYPYPEKLYIMSGDKTIEIPGNPQTGLYKKDIVPPSNFKITYEQKNNQAFVFGPADDSSSSISLMSNTPVDIDYIGNYNSTFTVDNNAYSTQYPGWTMLEISLVPGNKYVKASAEIPTGIQPIEAQGGECMYYDINGRRLPDHPDCAGFYIVTDGLHAQKIMTP